MIYYYNLYLRLVLHIWNKIAKKFLNHTSSISDANNNINTYQDINLFLRIFL